MKLKQCLPLLPQIIGDFFLKKALHEETHLFRQTYGGMFYIGTNDKIMQGEEKFQKCIF